MFFFFISGIIDERQGNSQYKEEKRWLKKFENLTSKIKQINKVRFKVFGTPYIPGLSNNYPTFIFKARHSGCKTVHIGIGQLNAHTLFFSIRSSEPVVAC